MTNKVKAYIADAAALIILTFAAILLTLAGVKPSVVKDKTKRMRIVTGQDLGTKGGTPRQLTEKSQHIISGGVSGQTSTLLT